VPSVLPTITTEYSEGCDNVTSTHFGSHAGKITRTSSLEGFAQGESEIARSCPTLPGPRNDHESQPTYTPLTTQGLERHNKQQALITKPLLCQQVSQQNPTTELEIPFISTYNLICDLHKEGIGYFISGSTNTPYRARTQHSGTGSMYNEADTHIPGYPSEGSCEHPSFYQGHDVDSSALDTCDVDPLSWDIESIRGEQLTAWGCPLAGIGQRFVEQQNQQCVYCDELVVD